MPEIHRQQITYLRVRDGKLFKSVNKQDIEVFAIKAKLKSIKYTERDVESDGRKYHLKFYDVVFSDGDTTWSWSADAASFNTLFCLNAFASLQDINSDIIFRPYLNKKQKTNIAVEENIGSDDRGTLVKGKYSMDEIPQREPVIVKGKHFEVNGVKQWNWEPVEQFIKKLADEISSKLGNSVTHDYEEYDDDDNSAEIEEIFAGVESA